MKTINTRDNVFVLNGDVIESSIKRLDALPDSSIIIIPHVCNNVNAYGAGFAQAIANRFPLAKENFHMLGKPGLKLGKVQYVTVAETKNKSKLIVANMIAQNGLISSKNKRPINYAALVFCLNDIKTFCSINKSEDCSIEIHAPKFGSGLAGGNWNFIYDIIQDVFQEIQFYIYDNRRIDRK